MTALLDTSSIIGMTERRNQSPSVRALLERAVDDDAVLVSDITLGELRHAMRAATPGQLHTRSLTYDVAEAFTIVSVNGDFGVIDAYAHARTTTPRCSQNDTWIIALAKRHGATLHTEDSRMAELAERLGVGTVLSTSDPA